MGGGALADMSDKNLYFFAASLRDVCERERGEYGESRKQRKIIKRKIEKLFY